MSFDELDHLIDPEHRRLSDREWTEMLRAAYGDVVDDVIPTSGRSYPETSTSGMIRCPRPRRPQRARSGAAVVQYRRRPAVLVGVTPARRSPSSYVIAAALCAAVVLAGIVANSAEAPRTANQADRAAAAVTRVPIEPAVGGVSSGFLSIDAAEDGVWVAGGQSEVHVLARAETGDTVESAVVFVTPEGVYRVPGTLAPKLGDALDGALVLTPASDLSDHDLTGATLVALDLSRAALHGTDLSGADLSAASLTYADLSEAQLTDARLVAADLSQADLSDADLRGADLRGADLSQADLSRADLTDADLRAADLTEAHLDGARGANGTWEGADLPAGFELVDDGAACARDACEGSSAPEVDPPADGGAGVPTVTAPS